MIYLALGAFAAFWLILWYLRRETLNRGKLEEKNKTSSEVLKDANDAVEIRDRLRTDADYSQRVRDRFSRD